MSYAPPNTASWNPTSATLNASPDYVATTITGSFNANDASGGGPYKFQVAYGGIDGGPYDVELPVIDGGSGVIPFVTPPGIIDGDYYFIVRISNNGGVDWVASDQIGAINYSTPIPPPVNTAYWSSDPPSLSAEQSGGIIIGSFDSMYAAGGAPYTYRVMYGTTSGSYDTEATQSGSSGTITFETGMLSAGDYYFVVQITNIASFAFGDYAQSVEFGPVSFA